MSVTGAPQGHQLVLSRLVGGFADPLREVDLLTRDQPLKPYPPLRRWRYNAGIRLLIFVLATLVISLAIGLAVGLALALLQPAKTPQFDSFATNALAIPGLVAGYLLLTMWWEQRRRGSMIPEVSQAGLYELTPRRAAGLLYGLAWGVVLQLVCVGILAIVGVYQVQGFDWSYNIVPMLLGAGFGAAINEEILFRGILYRLLEDTVGTWGAIAISGLTFGLVHLTNDHATLQGALAIALEAGVLFGALYALTRSLWLVMGLHFAWNMVQGPILGINVSGTSSAGSGYIRSTLTGPDLLSGGGFGMEASLVTVVILTGIAIWAIVVLKQRGLVVEPSWIRRRRLAATAPVDPVQSDPR